ncbi:DUF4825 domain-containing protein [Alkalihalobacillus oceani]|uniref:DUF4825 domain-containing protein n=1 Tax=Halalkalibacter oceani TaxID=1653776 RepID=UPI002041F274|nr:DUF4825 domain-containing protein [Halalkalibacter oceani]MCM3760952.1 DUF4825 domain-containing protein [Halalkalibacter oceani]
MNVRHRLIMMISVIGVIGFFIVQTMVLPSIAEKEEAYQAAQNEAMSHDIEQSRRYQHNYMGDAGNLTQLFRSLPLREVPMSFELDSERYRVQVNFEGNVDELDRRKREQAFIYNATAAFALIGNLQEIDFHFNDRSFGVEREAVEEWYEQPLPSLIEDGSWERMVRQPLADADYLESCTEAFF